MFFLASRMRLCDHVTQDDHGPLARVSPTPYPKAIFEKPRGHKGAMGQEINERKKKGAVIPIILRTYALLTTSTSLQVAPYPEESQMRPQPWGISWSWVHRGPR